MPDPNFDDFEVNFDDFDIGEGSAQSQSDFGAVPSFFQRLAGVGSDALRGAAQAGGAVLSPLLSVVGAPKRGVDFWSNYLSNPTLRNKALLGEEVPAEELALGGWVPDSALGGAAKGVSKFGLGIALDPTTPLALLKSAKLAGVLASPAARIANPALKAGFAGGAAVGATGLVSEALNEYSRTGNINPQMVEKLTQAGLLGVVARYVGKGVPESYAQAKQSYRFVTGPKPLEQFQGPNRGPEVAGPELMSDSELARIQSREPQPSIGGELDPLVGTLDPEATPVVEPPTRLSNKPTDSRYFPSSLIGDDIPDIGNLDVPLGGDSTTPAPAHLRPPFGKRYTGEPEPTFLSGDEAPDILSLADPANPDARVGGIEQLFSGLKEEGRGLPTLDPYEMFGPDYLDAMRDSSENGLPFSKPVPSPVVTGPATYEQLRLAYERLPQDIWQGEAQPIPDNLTPQTERGILQGQIEGFDPSSLTLNDIVGGRKVPGKQKARLLGDLEARQQLGQLGLPEPQPILDNGPGAPGDTPFGDTRISNPEPVPGQPLPRPVPTGPTSGSVEPLVGVLEDLGYESKPSPVKIATRIKQLFQPVSDEQLIQYDSWLRDPKYHPQLAQRAGAVALSQVVEAATKPPAPPQDPTSPDAPLPGSSGVSDTLGKGLITLLNSSRLIAGGDYSFIGRQGWKALQAHPGLWAENAIKGLRSGWSALTAPRKQAVTEALYSEMLSDPLYPLFNELGGIRRDSRIKVRHTATLSSLTKEEQAASVTEALARRPEEWVGSLPDAVRPLGKVLAPVARPIAVVANASDVANTTFADGLRFGIFKQGAAKLQALGVDPTTPQGQAAYRAFVDVANVLSGIGDIAVKKLVFGDIHQATTGNSLAKKILQPILTVAAFSPNLRAAMITSRNPLYMRNLNQATQMLPLAERPGTRLAGAGVAELALVSLGALAVKSLIPGADFITDPEDSGFGKFKIQGKGKGDYYWDPMGISSTVRTAYQLTTGRKKTATGREVYLNDPEQRNPQTRWDVMAQYGRSLFNPGVAQLANTLTGRKVTGEEYEGVLPELGGEFTSPLWARDPWEAAGSEPSLVGPLALAGGQFFGANMAYYNPLIQSYRRAHNGQDPSNRAELDRFIAAERYKAQILNTMAERTRAINAARGR